MGRILTNEEFQGLGGESVKVLADSDFRNMTNMASSDRPTTGIWDALKRGLSNSRGIIQESGEELADVMATPTSNDLKGKFTKTAAAAGKLIKGPIKVGAELALATPARAIGEVVEGATGYDVNEATAKKAQELMQKGLSNEKVQQASAWYNQLKEKDPEAALALGAVGDIIDAASNAVGLGVTKQAVSGTLRGAVSAAKATGEAVETGTKAAMKPVKALTGGKTGEYAASQVFGLNPETVRQVLKNPDIFTPSEMAKIDRESIFNKVRTAIDSRLEGLSETGKAYEAIRKSGQKVTFPEGFGQGVLQKYGIGVRDGKLEITSESLPLGQGDIAGIENFIKTYGNTELTANGILNARKALDNLSGWGSDKTSGGKTIARALRAELDKVAKGSIKGLADLDAKFAPEKKLLTKVKSAIYNADGTLKDNAVQKIATLTGKGKELAIERMEKIVPGIREDLNILKAIEDVQAAGGQKVGTYMRAIGGVGAGAAFGGPVGAVLGVLATSPKVGIALLRTYAKYKNIPKSQVNGIVEKMKAGKRLIGEELQVMNEAVDNAAQKAGERVKSIGEKGGLSIKDVSGGKAGYSDPLLQEARKYKSAEEFVKSQVAQIGAEVRDKVGTKLQNPYTADYLPTNPDGTITLYHSTTKESAEKVKQSGLLGSKAEGGDIYFTTNKRGYGGIGKDKDVVLAFNVDPKKVKFDDVFRGELHLKGNNVDIGGIKPVEIKTKSQLTDLWKKANQSAPEQSLLQEARKYKSAEEFVKAQGETVYRGGLDLSQEKITESGISVSKGKNIAEDFVKQKGGKVEEMLISPNAKIANYSDIPNVKFKNLNDYSPELDTGNKQIWQDLEGEYQKAVDWAKENGYDAVKLPLEGETRIINPNVLKTKSQLTDLWKKAHGKSEPNKQVQYQTKQGWKTMTEIAEAYMKRTAATKDQAFEWARDQVKGLKGRVNSK